ncbi:MAG: helix-turn-helix transcriptional regulator [Anaerovoracaceae bacterium]|nr:helix-turn-helix transcriptional regulator [Bacillota bacterium]MEE0516525.1 helix-turn-helix transcriptional regulator [Anaerovoracaceae bacterium]
MNQEKIGKFIAQLRRERGLTQEQLGEMLGITGKAVSKWETAKSLPDPSLYKPICAIFEITLTELFNGERISAENAVEKTDQVLSEFVKKSVVSKTVNIFTAVLIVVGIVFIFASAVSGLGITASIVMISAGLLFFLLSFAIRISVWRLSGSKVVKNTGMGFSGALTIVFITLKLMGYIKWPWVWVLSPIWISVAAVIGIIVIGLLIVAVTDWIKKRK